ncbi:BON domain-containing protein [bacterium]|nr:BON domain-containing protein [bacterium]
MKKIIIILFVLALSVLAYAPVTWADEVRTSNQNNPDKVSREDGVITSDVRNKITEDERLRGLILDVKTQNGIVTVSGKAHSQDEIDRAIELARNTPGVVSANSLMKIDSASTSDALTPTPEDRKTIVEKGQKELDEAADISGDARIENEVKSKFAADDMIKSRNIRITSKDGIVTLQGTVELRRAR